MNNDNANDPSIHKEEPASGFGNTLSQAVKVVANKRINNASKTKDSLAASVVNDVKNVMLENPSLDMKDILQALEDLVPGASGDTFKRKLRAKLRELNNPEINRILKPRNRKRKVKTKDSGQRISAPVKDPEAIVLAERSRIPEMDPTPVENPKNDHEDDILNGLILGLGNDKPDSI